MKYLLLILFISLSCLGPEEKYNLNSEIYPAKSILIGHNGMPEITKISKELIKIAHGEKIKVDLIVPSFLEDTFKEDYKEFTHDLNFVHLEDKTLWAQDIFEYLHLGDKTFILDLPYKNREGENTPLLFSSLKKLPLLKSVTDNALSLEDGDFGGNIEGINDEYYLVGNNISSSLRDVLDSRLKQKKIELDVSFLLTGHVDEVIKFLPLNKNKDCPGLFLYPSSSFGSELLSQNRGEIKISETFSMMDTKHLEGLELIQKCYQEKSNCEELIKNFKDIDKKILKNISKIKEIFKGCKEESFISLPVLFYPYTSLRYFSLNSNMINGIYLNDVYLYPSQKYSPFNEVIYKKLSPFIKVKGIEADYLNSLQGGLHCLTNVLRQKEKK